MNQMQMKLLLALTNFSISFYNFFRFIFTERLFIIIARCSPKALMLLKCEMSSNTKTDLWEVITEMHSGAIILY